MAVLGNVNSFSYTANMKDPVEQIKELRQGLNEGMPLKVFAEKMYELECEMCADFLRSSAHDIDRRAIVLEGIRIFRANLPDISDIDAPS